MILRKANIYDINDIAKVHCEVWNDFYGKYVSKEFLQKLSFANRKKFWLHYINDGHIVYLVEEKQGAGVGFIVPKLKKISEDEIEGEILAHYMSKKFQNQGYGTALMLTCAKLFVKNGVNNMSLWIHRDNPSVAVYRKLGAEEINLKLFQLDGKDIVKINYKWNDLEAFIEKYEYVLDKLADDY